MRGVIEGVDRTQTTLLPEAIDDYAGEGNPVRVVDAFVDAIDLATSTAISTRCSRGLERECRRNLELI